MGFNRHVRVSHGARGYPTSRLAVARLAANRLAALLFVLIVLIASPETAYGHAQLDASSPPADALLAVPPGEITLRFTEPVDPAAIDVRLLGEDGAPLEVAAASVDPSDPRLIRATTRAVAFGITTVSWTTRSATDGHTLSGSFAFRVGGSSRAPAAATVEGNRPAPWNVATRWLTFLGLALAVGTALVDRTPRRRRLVFAGVLVALLASMAEPILLWALPPDGWVAPGFAEAFRAQPGAWWLRPAAAIGVVSSMVGIGAVRDGHGGSARRSWLRRHATTAVGLIGLLGLALTAHAAGRESLRVPALASVILHEWSVALWVGGLLQIVLARSPGWTVELRRFSRLVLPVAVLAIVTGVANAGFLYPSVDRLRAIRESDYGWVLIAKVTVVAIVLTLAGLHRLLLRGEGRPSPTFRLSLPAEAGAVALVLIAASTLAMLTPPGEAGADRPTRVELALPASDSVDDDQLYVKLVVEPGEDERRRLTVSATDGAPLATIPSTDGGYEVVRAPAIPDLQMARITLSSLTSTIAPTTYDLTAIGDGTFSRDGFAFAVDGWWRADVTVRRPGVDDHSVSFYLLEPNPNVVGLGNVPEPEGDPEAAAIQAEARALLEARSSYAYVEALNGGDGGVEVIRTSFSDNAAGSRQRGIEISSDELTLIRLDGRRYVRQGDSAWIETGDSPVLTPAEVAVDYDGAEQIRMAGEEEIEGELCRRITFHVPATTVSAAWYVWWVSAETGELRQETMVSRAHYMVKRYTAVNAPIEIVAPV